MPFFSELDQHRATKLVPEIVPKPTRRKVMMRWDPAANELVWRDRPPTRKQLDYLRGLSKQLGVEFVRPKTRRDADRALRKLIHRQRRRARKAR
jgi:hypothetical protein